MDAVTWEDVLKAKCYVINMDRDFERFDVTSDRIREAGFGNIVRYKAIDAMVDNLEKEWNRHGNPKFGGDPSFIVHKGEQGCNLSHMGVWLDVIEKGLPYAVVFEDDISFHKDWCKLALEYWDQSPKDFDILFMGSQLDNIEELSAKDCILQEPIYCTHAYVITFEGAKRLYNYLVGHRKGMFIIDCMLRYGMCMHEKPFIWYAWNGMKFLDNNRGSNPHWIIRNTGLVYQDEVFGSNIKQR